MYGQTQPSSQNNAPKLNGSNETLTKWENISGKFQSELTALQQDLQTALNDANQSKVSLQKSIALYVSSLQRTQNLENYNQQIAERMQERDEDLAQAYTKIDRLEKVLRRVIIACAVFACLFVLSIALRYFRLI
jgi:predicted  nucleic acid-binding Zn-ribbon protein